MVNITGDPKLIKRIKPCINAALQRFDTVYTDILGQYTTVSVKKYMTNDILIEVGINITVRQIINSDIINTRDVMVNIFNKIVRCFSDVYWKQPTMSKPTQCEGLQILIDPRVPTDTVLIHPATELKLLKVVNHAPFGIPRRFDD